MAPSNRVLRGYTDLLMFSKETLPLSNRYLVLCHAISVQSIRRVMEIDPILIGTKWKGWGFHLKQCQAIVGIITKLFKCQFTCVDKVQ